MKRVVEVQPRARVVNADDAPLLGPRGIDDGPREPPEHLLRVGDVPVPVLVQRQRLARERAIADEGSAANLIASASGHFDNEFSFIFRGVEIKLEEFSTRLLAHPEWPTNDLTWADGEIFDGVNWRWSGLSREQEAMEAEGLATAARAFRAMAFDLELDFGGGRGTVGSESGCDSEDCSSGDESDEYFENYYEDFY